MCVVWYAANAVNALNLWSQFIVIQFSSFRYRSRGFSVSDIVYQ